MKISRRHAALVAGLALSCCAALAQTTARIVVPVPAGGGTDQYVRLLAAEMSKRGYPIVVDNKPGASGIVAADHVAKARPDGNTILVSTLGTLASNTVLYEKLPYDPAKDFAPVTQIGYQPSIMVGRADLPYQNYKQLVEYAKANPGKVNRGSPGASILTNLAPMRLEQVYNFKTTHIPFNGDAPAIQALLSNTIDIHGTSITGPLAHIRSGKLRVLGVMDSKRLPQVPDAPTFKEMGFDMEALLWYSFSVPAATPRAEIDKLHKAVNQVLVDPEFIAKARAIGMEPRGSTPDELSQFIKVEAERWVPLLRSLNLPKESM